MHLMASESNSSLLSSLLLIPQPLLPYLSAILSARQGQTGLRRSALIKTGGFGGGGGKRQRWQGCGRPWSNGSCTAVDGHI